MNYIWGGICLAWLGLWIAAWFVPEIKSNQFAYLALMLITFHFATSNENN